MPVDPKRVQAVFLVAVEQTDPAGRAAVLDRECASDAELRHRVEALLRANDEPGSILGRPTASPGQTIDEIASKEPADSSPPTESRPAENGGGIVAGRYKLLEQIGEGGMGTVWVAEQTLPVRRKVALKLIKAGMDSKTVLSRFEAERQALALMDHPNIAKVLDGGTTETGRPFFVMEYVKGIPLVRYCDDARLSIADRLALFVPVCQAVQHAHQKGIIHRDLKPSNILICLYDGKPVPKVIDFGLAKAMHQPLTEHTLYTAHGAMMGTPLYMSPEQAEINNLDVDTRADVYALGVILYELLTGTTPLEKHRFKEAAWQEMLRLIKEEEPPRPSARLSGSVTLPNVAAYRHMEPAKLTRVVRGELDWIVMKCLEKDRSRRYETANGLARDVERYLSDDVVEARPPSASYRLKKFLRRHKGPVLMTGMLLLALVSGIIGTTYGFIRAESARQEAVAAQRDEAVQRRLAEQERDAKDKARKEAEANAARANEKTTEANAHAKRANDNADEARANLYVACMNLAQTAWENGYVRRVKELLDLYRQPRPNSKDLRGWEWFYQDRLCHENSRTLQGHCNGVRGVAFSPDGTRLASASADKTVKIWEVSTGRLLASLIGHTGFVDTVAFSPDGTQLASTSVDGTVKLWNVTQFKERHTLNAARSERLSFPVEATPTSAAFSPDGTRLSTASVDGTVKVWEVNTGRELRNLNLRSLLGSCVAFSPDGTLLAFAAFAGGREGTVEVWEVGTGRLLCDLKAHTRPSFANSLAFSPDATRLASASCRDQTVRVWEISSKQEIRTFTGYADGVLRVAFSPDGTRLAATSYEGAMKVWEVSSGQELGSLKEHTSGVWGVAFSPDGTRLASASADKTVRVWGMSSRQELGASSGHTSLVASVAFSPDGTRLASASWDKTVKIWDASSNLTLRTLGGHTDIVTSIAFSPNGTRLASGAGDGSVRIWEVDSGKELRRLLGHTSTNEQRGLVSRLAFTPDGARLVSASWDTTVKVWDVNTGQELRTIKRDTSAVAGLGVAFSWDGTRLAFSRNDSTVGIWDLDRGEELLALKGHASRVSHVVFSRNGIWLASASDDGTVKVWDVRTGHERWTLKGHSAYIETMTFSPDDSQLASSSQDQTFKVWEVSSGQELRSLTGHAGTVRRVAFNPDGRRLASASLDRTVKVWDLSAGQELRTLKGYTSHVLDVVFSPDGTRLASGGSDGTVKVWDASPLTEESQAEREALRLVDLLFSRPLPKVEVIKSIRTSPAITEDVRKRAVNFADRFQEERDPKSFNDASKASVRHRYLASRWYNEAVVQAETACRLAPDNGSYRTTLGMARYRLGKFAEAAEMLRQAVQLNESKLKSPAPADLAFLAMAHYQLGHKDQAQEFLKRLRETVKLEQWDKNEEAQGFLREAEVLIEGSRAEPKK